MNVIVPTEQSPISISITANINEAFKLLENYDISNTMFIFLLLSTSRKLTNQYRHFKWAFFFFCLFCVGCKQYNIKSRFQLTPLHRIGNIFSYFSTTVFKLLSACFIILCLTYSVKITATRKRYLEESTIINTKTKTKCNHKMSPDCIRSAKRNRHRVLITAILALVAGT